MLSKLIRNAFVYPAKPLCKLENGIKLMADLIPSYQLIKVINFVAQRTASDLVGLVFEFDVRCARRTNICFIKFVREYFIIDSVFPTEIV